MTDTKAHPGAGLGVRSDDRLSWLDNLRTFLTALVLLHHSAITYSHIPLWTYWEEPHDASATLLDAVVVTNQMWFMGLFFLISGYFVPSAVDRHGVAGFLRGRLLRLGVPLVIFVVVLRPLFVLPAWLGLPDRGAFWPLFLSTIDPGPLWFVVVLLVFSFGYATLRVIADDPRAVPASGPVRPWAVAALGLGLGVATFGWRILVPNGAYWPVVGLPTPSFLPQYLLCFAIGCMAARRAWLTSIPTRVALVAAGLAVPCLVAYPALIIAHDDANGGVDAAAFVAALAVSFAAVFVVTAVLWAFRRWVAGTGKRRKWLAANTFAVYVLHAPVLALLGMALAGWTAPAVVKAAGLWALGAVICWTMAAGLRRLPGARRVF